MEARTRIPIDVRCHFAFAAMALLALVPLPVRAADIVLTPPAGGGVSVTNAGGNVTRFRVADDGTVTLNGALELGTSTSSAGNILKGGFAFIHDFGAFNIFTGRLAGNFSMTGSANSAFGASAFQTNTTGNENTAIGAYALNGNTTGNSNTALGVSTLQNNSTGGFNTASGEGALAFNAIGNQNTASGASALRFNSTGSYNTAAGANAMLNNTTGSGNTASGMQALFSNTTGSGNTATGVNGLFMNTTGGQNTAHGNFSLVENTTGEKNTASGASALRQNVTGLNNTASGASALQNNETGGNNTAAGFNALGSNLAGNGNTASGVNAAFNTSAGFNTAIGISALFANTTGDSNIAIGVNAGNALTTGSRNIAIGNNGIAGEGNTIRLGDANQSRAFIAGIRGVTTGSANAIPVMVDSNGQLGTVSSSARFKDDIADMDSATDALMQLRPVTFHYKADQDPAGRTLQYGLVAEEVAQVYPGLVAHSPDGKVETVLYQFLPAMLLNEVQKQQRTIEAQASELRELRALRSEVAAIRRQLEQIGQR